MKKKYILFAVFMATVTVLSGCTKKTAQDEAATSESTQAAAETTESGTDAGESSSSIDVSNLKTTTLLDVDLDKLVTLGEYKGIEVVLSKKEVTDEDVASSLKSG